MLWYRRNCPLFGGVRYSEVFKVQYIWETQLVYTVPVIKKLKNSTVPRQYLNSTITVLKQYLNSTKTVLKQYLNSTKTVLKQYLNSTKTVLERYQNST